MTIQFSFQKVQLVLCPIQIVLCPICQFMSFETVFEKSFFEPRDRRKYTQTHEIPPQSGCPPCPLPLPPTHLEISAVAASSIRLWMGTQPVPRSQFSMYTMAT